MGIVGWLVPTYLTSGDEVWLVPTYLTSGEANARWWTGGAADDARRGASSSSSSDESNTKGLEGARGAARLLPDCPEGAPWQGASSSDGMISLSSSFNEAAARCRQEGFFNFFLIFMSAVELEVLEKIKRN